MVKGASAHHFPVGGTGAGGVAFGSIAVPIAKRMPGYRYFASKVGKLRRNSALEVIVIEEIEAARALRKEFGNGVGTGARAVNWVVRVLGDRVKNICTTNIVIGVECVGNALFIIDRVGIPRRVVDGS